MKPFKNTADYEEQLEKARNEYEEGQLSLGEFWEKQTFLRWFFELQFGLPPEGFESFKMLKVEEKE